MQKILIIGATSAIAEATARLYAAKGAGFFLLARNGARLERLAADLKVRGASSVETALLDVNDIASHQPLLNKAHDALGRFDVALLAHGTLGDQQKCEAEVEAALEELQTNAVSTIALLTALANMMEKQQGGTIAVISSVAGDRGRPSNYVYGTAKAAVTTFCEGLRARMFKKGVHVLTIKPGIVDTPMTEGMDLPKVLLATPEAIAADIVRAIDRKKDTLYTPLPWKFVMLGITLLPERIFKNLKL
jgi:decaprenylphospho-beta-D-erythro-pentofuranosid-2-ulose 2-reductase